MKKLIFSLTVMIGLSFCSNHVVAQNVPQYEYASLVVYESITFIKPDGQIEVSEFEKTPIDIKGAANKMQVNLSYNLSQAVNRRAKEGWEVVMAMGNGAFLRRQIKK